MSTKRLRRFEAMQLPEIETLISSCEKALAEIKEIEQDGWQKGINRNDTAKTGRRLELKIKDLYSARTTVATPPLFPHE